MKSVAITTSLFLCFILGFIVVQQTSASARPVSVAQDVASTAVELGQVPISAPEAEALKKCNFNSDCPYGKCDKHVCGGCNFNSECKGWGKCQKHKCGSCNFDSDCKGFGKCSSHRCTKSPY